jgi:hypothetical protein
VVDDPVVAREIAHGLLLLRRQWLANGDPSLPRAFRLLPALAGVAGVDAPRCTPAVSRVRNGVRLRQAAEAAGVSRQRLHALVARGRFGEAAWRDDSGAWLIDEEALVAWMDERAVGAAAC